jgi:beta-glucosidase
VSQKSVICKFRSTEIYAIDSVTENGFAAKSDAVLPLPDVVHDVDRVEYFGGYANALLEAVTLDDVSVQSYFAWST